MFTDNNLLVILALVGAYFILPFKKLKDFKKYITPCNVFLGIVVIVMIYKTMEEDISPFCTINTDPDPGYITVDEFRGMDIDINNHRDQLAGSYSEICSECQHITDEPSCSANNNCSFITDQHTDQTINFGPGIEPYICRGIRDKGPGTGHTRDSRTGGVDTPIGAKGHDDPDPHNEGDLLLDCIGPGCN